MPCPRCVGECRCGLGNAEPDYAVLVDPDSYDPSEEQFSQSLISARLPETRNAVQAAISQQDATAQEAWRREVAQRVTRYRTRRGYPENALSFDFDAEPNDLVSAVAPTVEGAVAPALEVSAREQVLSDSRPEAKVIEFPRASEEIITTQMLVEPVQDLPPRIFEAEPVEQVEDDQEDEEALLEEWNTSVAIAAVLPSFNLDANTESATPVEIPMLVAPVGMRALVALIDVVIAGLAAGLFTFVASQFGALPADPKVLLAAEVLVFVFFWFSYQMLYLTYAGATMGMAITRLALVSFEGEPVSRLRRQARAVSMLLSGLSAGLGFAWAFFDEDTLCWHDRITRTVLR
ncbi:MAG: RDD family protein [Acidobacteriales bacterium]|nr:RDD family protein [Terriglobales bacterium]